MLYVGTEGLGRFGLGSGQARGSCGTGPLQAFGDLGWLEVDGSVYAVAKDPPKAS